MHYPQPRRLYVSILSCCGLLCLLAGCGDGRINTYPVAGTILVDGEPAEGAMVVFCPTEGSDELMDLRPWAKTNENGEFELATFVRGDGAPEGEYKVTVQWLRDPTTRGGQSRNTQQDERGGPVLRDALGGRYAKPSTTDLTAVVEGGATELPPFELEAGRSRKK